MGVLVGAGTGVDVGDGNGTAVGERLGAAIGYKSERTFTTFVFPPATKISSSCATATPLMCVAGSDGPVVHDDVGMLYISTAVRSHAVAQPPIANSKLWWTTVVMCPYLAVGIGAATLHALAAI